MLDRSWDRVKITTGASGLHEIVTKITARESMSFGIQTDIASFSISIIWKRRSERYGQKGKKVNKSFHVGTVGEVVVNSRPILSFKQHRAGRLEFKEGQSPHRGPYASRA